MGSYVIEVGVVRGFGSMGVLLLFLGIWFVSDGGGC